MRATPLYCAVKSGTVKIVEYLLLHGADPNLSNKYAETPLFIAATKGIYWMDIIKLLVEGNADVNSCNNDGRSALFMAVMDENIPTTEYLATHGADLNVTDFELSCPLLFAASKHYYDLVQCLVRQGCDLNRVDVSGSW